jgi:hypothetical protein
MINSKLTYMMSCTLQNTDRLNREYMQFQLAKLAVKYDA